MKMRRISLFAIGSSLVLGFACSDEAPSSDVEIGDAAVETNDSGATSADDDSNDATVSDSSSTTEASVADGSTDDGASNLDADATPSAAPAHLLGLSLDSIGEGDTDTLCATATDLLPTARLYFNGTLLPAIVADGGAVNSDASASDPQQLCATVTVAVNSPTGLIPVYIENTPGDAATRSNVYPLEVRAANGFRIFDIQPDNGNPGDTVRVLGANLGASFTITDSTGVISSVLSTVDGGGTMYWPTESSTLQYAEFVIPGNWHSGTVSFSNGANVHRGSVFNIGTNLSTTANVSTNGDYSGWPFSKAVDNNLATSWFTANGICATDMSCGAIPVAEIEFATPKSIGRVAIRGNREYVDDYDFKKVRLEIRGPKPTDAGVDSGAALGPVLFTRDVVLPLPMRDADVILSPAVSGASIRLVSLEDESTDPGLAEIEVFEN